MGGCVSAAYRGRCSLFKKSESRRKNKPDQMDEKKRPRSPVPPDPAESVDTKRICTRLYLCEDDHVNEELAEKNADSSVRRRHVKKNASDSCLHVSVDDISLGLKHHINNLPHSLLIQIFRMLPMYDLLQRASLVCKYWLQLSRDPDLWRVVDVQGMLKVDDGVLLELTSYSDNVTGVDITDSRLVTSAGIIQMLTKCQKLQMFKAARCQQLTDPAFAAIGENCHCLTRLHLDNCFALTDQAITEIARGCPRLMYLGLIQCFQITDEGVINVTRGCPQLRYIMLDQCTMIADKSVIAISENCKDLEDLSLMGCDLTEEGILCLTKCHKLKILELSNIRKTTCKAVKQIILHCKELTSLNLCLCHEINDDCVEFMAKYGKRLRKLHLVSCKITDKALVHIGQYSTSLEHVDVGWCEDITDEGVRRIADMLKSLRFLGLIRCDKVTIPTMEDLVDSYPDVTFSTVYLDCKRLIEKARSQGFIPPDQTL